MNLPKAVKDIVAKTVQEKADELDWMRMTITEKAKYYEIWAADESIGGKLSFYMPFERVHKYIKDTIVKEYSRSRKHTSNEILIIIGCKNDKIPKLKDYIKPLGTLLADGRLICWGRAKDWKIVLLSAFERMQTIKEVKTTIVVLTDASGNYKGKAFTKLAKDASERLQVSQLYFVE